MLKDIIETFEELKKYVFIVNRGDKKNIIITFNDSNFYHLIGLHKMGIDRFFPDYIKTKSRKYEYIKKNIDKFDGIIKNHIHEKDTLQYRVKSFPRILDLLRSNQNVSLYDLSIVPKNSLYDGDYGIFKVYEDDISCLLGLKSDIVKEEVIYCAPQSWMADKRSNVLTKNKKPLYMSVIVPVSVNIFKDDFIYA